MKRSRIAFLLPSAALLAMLVAAVPARADQVVYFVNGKAMTVKSVERGDRVTILEIEGGGRIGVPSVQIDRVEELQLSAPAAAAAVVPPPAPAPVQPAANLQANAVVPGPAAAPATAAVVPGVVAPPPSALAVDPKTGLPAHGPGHPGGPLTEEQLEGGPPQALPPAYNPGAARGGQYGMQAGGIGIGSHLNNNMNGVIGRPDGPGRRLNARLGAFGRVRPPMSAPPPVPPGQGQAPAGQGATAPGSAPTGAAAPPPPAAPQPPAANPQPPPDSSQNDQGADNGSSNPPAADDPAPSDPPADENPPDGEN